LFYCSWDHCIAICVDLEHQPLILRTCRLLQIVNCSGWIFGQLIELHLLKRVIIEYRMSQENTETRQNPETQQNIETPKNAETQQNDSCILHIENFDGPLDLLWSLIRKSKIDIVDVSIAEITRQYLLYLKEMEIRSVSIAIEFIQMGSELLYYKSKALLPTSEMDDGFFIPPLPKELIEKLLEYKRFQKTAQEMKERYDIHSETFSRENDFAKLIDNGEYTSMSLFDLLNAFVDVMGKSTKPEEKEIIFDEILVSDRIDLIITMLRQKEQITFKHLFHAIPSISEVVATFLAVLELAKMHKIRVLQHQVFGTIHLFRNFEIDETIASIDLTHQ